MDPQNQQNQLQKQQEFSSQKIIGMMRITKKTDPLFKPLKKLKTALQGIGYEKISSSPTKALILFHFGLGNQLDFQFIKLTKPSNYGLNDSPILPGKSYCYLSFQSTEESQKYFKQTFKPIVQNLQVGYTELQYQNLSRILVCFYCKLETIQKQQLNVQLQDCPSKYNKEAIPGIIIVQQFVDKQQQLELLQQIDKQSWSKLNNRRVQHYGYQFKYGRNQIDKDEKFQSTMPEFILKVLDRLQKLELLPGYRFDQMTINDYFPGDGIPAHFDTHSPFQEHFVAISLLSGLVMDWRRYDGTEKQVYLAPRSLIIFSGEGRYAWTHAISCRKMDKIDGQLRHRSRRISLTLRKIKFSPCKCPYYFYCDSQGYDQSTMKKANPLLKKYLAETVKNTKLKQLSSEQIYKSYVIDAYRGFGFDFHNRAIEGVNIMISSFFKTACFDNKLYSILDVGCGNGQYQENVVRIEEQAQVFVNYVGIQICQNMKPFVGKILMDGLSLAFRPQSFELVLCIAVLHHMADIKQRLKMLQQLKKVLKSDGVIILSVFGHEQKKEIYENQDILLQYCVSNTKMKERQCQNQKQQNENVRKQKRGQIYQRYYHLFKQEQLLDLFKQIGLHVVDLQTDKQNIIIMAKKDSKSIIHQKDSPSY